MCTRPFLLAIGLVLIGLQTACGEPSASVASCEEPSEDVYGVGSHGIRQDMMLAATALHLPSHPRAKEMLGLAQSRLKQAADILFTNEGIWMEHAPAFTWLDSWLTWKNSICTRMPSTQKCS